MQSAQICITYWNAINLCSFRIYNLINEYLRDVESTVISTLLRFRKLKWEHITFVFQQRNPTYHFYSYLILVSCLNGNCNHVTFSELRIVEFVLFSLDINVLNGLTMFDWLQNFGFFGTFVNFLVFLQRTLHKRYFCIAGFSNTIHNYIIHRISAC